MRGTRVGKEKKDSPVCRSNTRVVLVVVRQAVLIIGRAKRVRIGLERVQGARRTSAK